jgi:hypothetical protein
MLTTYRKGRREAEVRRGGCTHVPCSDAYFAIIAHDDKAHDIGVQEDVPVDTVLRLMVDRTRPCLINAFRSLAGAYCVDSQSC